MNIVKFIITRRPLTSDERAKRRAEAQRITLENEWWRRLFHFNVKMTMHKKRARPSRAASTCQPPSHDF